MASISTSLSDRRSVPQPGGPAPEAAVLKLVIDFDVPGEERDRLYGFLARLRDDAHREFERIFGRGEGREETDAG